MAARAADSIKVAAFIANCATASTPMTVVAGRTKAEPGSELVQATIQIFVDTQTHSDAPWCLTSTTAYSVRETAKTPPGGGTGRGSQLISTRP